MWDQLERPWQAAFEEAWEAYCHGSIPIGAVLANQQGEVLYRGRNRVHEFSAPGQQVCNNRLAHAEINVLLQLLDSEPIDPRELVLYTTQEPCVQCFGAIALSRIRIVRFAGRDPIAGGTHLSGLSEYVKGKQIDVQGARSDAERFLEDVQRIFSADYVLRNLTSDKAEMNLTAYSQQTPQSVELGRRWYAEDRLVHAKDKGYSVADVMKGIYEELHSST